MTTGLPSAGPAADRAADAAAGPVAGAVAGAPPAAPRRGWIRRLAPWLRPHRRKVILAFGFALLGSAITAAVPTVERQVIDNVIIAHRSALAPWMIVLGVAAVVSFAAAYVRRFVGGRVGLDVQYDLRNAIFDQLQRLDFARHDQLQTGQLVSRANSDVALLQGLLAFLPLMAGNRAAAHRVAGDHVRVLAHPGGGEPAGGARAVLHRPAHAGADLPGQLGFPAARGGGGRRRRGGRLRCPRRQGVRPGGARAVAPGGPGPDPLRLTGPSGPLPGPLPAAARRPAGRRAGRRSRPRWVPGDPPTRSRWGPFSPSPPTWSSWPLPPGCSPLCCWWPSRPGPAPSGSSTCSTPTPSSPSGPTPNRCPRRPATSSSTTCALGTPRTAPCSTTSPCRYPPVRRWPWSAPRGRASPRSRCCCPASTTSAPARSGSTAPMSATSPWTHCAARSGWSSRRASCSPTPSGPTSPTAGPTPPTRWSRPRPEPPRPTSSSPP